MFYFIAVGILLIAIWFHMTVVGGYRNCTLAAGCALALDTPASVLMGLSYYHRIVLEPWLYNLLILAHIVFIGMATVSLFRKHILKHHCPWDKSAKR